MRVFLVVTPRASTVLRWFSVLGFISTLTFAGIGWASSCPRWWVDGQLWSAITFHDDSTQHDSSGRKMIVSRNSRICACKSDEDVKKEVLTWKLREYIHTYIYIYTYMPLKRERCVRYWTGNSDPDARIKIRKKPLEIHSINYPQLFRKKIRLPTYDQVLRERAIERWMASHLQTDRNCTRTRNVPENPGEASGCRGTVSKQHISQAIRTWYARADRQARGKWHEDIINIGGCSKDEDGESFHGPNELNEALLGHPHTKPVFLVIE